MYKFIKKEEDIYVLEYKNIKNENISKEFKNDISIAKEFESINVIARTKLMKDLTKQGITKKDLTVVRVENGKTYYDNSNYLELENTYTEQATLEILSDISSRKLGLGYMELIQDMGMIEDSKGIEKFTTDFINILQGKEVVDNIPSKE